MYSHLHTINIYLLIKYLLPFLGLELLISYNLLDDYGFFELNYEFVLNIVTVYLVYALLIKLFNPGKLLSSYKLYYYAQKCEYYFAFLIYIFFILSVFFILNNSNNFRYNSDNNNYSAFLVITLFIRGLVEFLVILDIIAFINSKKFIIFGSKNKVKYLLIVSLILSSHGLMPLLISVIISFIYIFGNKIKYWNRMNFKKLLFNVILLTILTVISVPIVYWAGWIIKTNSFEKGTAQLMRVLDLQDTATYFVLRYSVHYQSANYASLYSFGTLDINNNLFGNMVDNTRFRFHKLTGFGDQVDRPFINSTSRFNFDKIMYHDRNINKISVGASAGVIGSFSYLTKYPYNCIFSGIYLFSIFSILGFIKAKKISIIFVALILFLLRSFLAAPADYINIIETTTITYILHCMILLICLKLKH